MSRYRDVYELAAEVGGMYALVVAAARRAKQLREGRQPVVESTSGNPLTIAIQEFLEGKVVVRPPGAADEEPTAETEVVEVAAPEAPEDADAADENADESEDEAGDE